MLLREMEKRKKKNPPTSAATECVFSLPPQRSGVQLATGITGPLGGCSSWFNEVAEEEEKKKRKKRTLITSRQHHET